MWIRRMRVLRRFLRKYRAQGKVDKFLYVHLISLYSAISMIRKCHALLSQGLTTVDFWWW
jgi:ribosomal protein L19E